jgi:hypothetical protein
MTSGSVETVYWGGQWRNRIHTVQVLSTEYGTREEAAAAGRWLAREAGVEHIVRNVDGSIAERESYGHDSHDVPG